MFSSNWIYVLCKNDADSQKYVGTKLSLGQVKVRELENWNLTFKSFTPLPFSFVPGWDKKRRLMCFLNFYMRFKGI